MRKFLGIFLILFLIIFCFNLNFTYSCTVTSGTIQYSSTTNPPDVINYQTGDGYCKKSINPGGIILDLSTCENINKLIVGNNYIVGVKLLVPGFDFVEIPNEATPVTFAVACYKSMDDLCNNVDGINVSLSYEFVPDTKNEIISEVSNDLIHSGYLFLLVQIPNFTYKMNKIDPSNDLYVEVGLIDADVICPSCGVALCHKKENIGKISCIDSFSLKFPYVLCNSAPWWTGIAITNESNTNGKFKIFIHTVDNLYIFNKEIKPNEVSTFIVDQLLKNVDYSGTCWVSIESNFSMGGVCFFGDDVGHSCYLGK